MDRKLDSEKTESGGPDKSDAKYATVSKGAAKATIGSRITDGTVQGSSILRSGKYHAYVDAARSNLYWMVSSRGEYMDAVDGLRYQVSWEN